MMVGLQAGLATLGAVLATVGFCVLIWAAVEDKSRWRLENGAVGALMLCVGVGLFVATGTQGLWA